jgi:hypothetical protein
MRTSCVPLLLLALLASPILPALANTPREQPACPNLYCQSGHCIDNPSGGTMCLYEYNPGTGKMACVGAADC